MELARLLQPAMVVIEDVDLIARDRDEMGGPCEEVAAQQAAQRNGRTKGGRGYPVRAHHQPAGGTGKRAGRPARAASTRRSRCRCLTTIGRGKLVRLYGKGLPLDPAIVDEAVRRTEGVSAAFIKELMRRIAQGAIARDGGESVISADIDEALNDMLFAGGRLNVKLLGGAQEMAEA